MTVSDENMPPEVHEWIRQARHFCAYQERCSSEVLRKLRILGANEEQQKLVLQMLKDEGFVDDTRFAHTYAQGKYKNNQWGRTKIFLELMRRGIPSQVNQKAIDSIDEEDYLNVLQNLIEKKMHALKQKNAANSKEKTAYYCTGKGFEPDIVWRLINQNH